MMLLQTVRVPSMFISPYNITYTIVTTWGPACLKILQAKDYVLFITIASLPGTDEMAYHVYEMNQ